MRDSMIKNNGYSLSSSQTNIWNLEQAYKGTPMNNICETIRIRGTFDPVLIQQCLNLVLASDRSLRTQIILDELGNPVQYEKEYEKTQFPMLDFSLTNQDGITRWEESITREVMQLMDSPLYQFVILRIGEHEGGIFIKTHHLISDGWSQVALINKIAVTYLNLIDGMDTQLEAAPSYRLHVEEEQKYMASCQFDKDKAYWQDELKNVSQPVSLKEYNGVDISPVGYRRTYYLSEVMNHALTAFCTSHRVAPFAVFYMAIAIFLKRTRGIERFCMGSPVHNRSSFTDRKTTGMFVSTLPFFSELDEEWSFEAFNGYLTDSWLDLLRHQKMPYDLIFSASRKENPEVNRLYHLVLSFHNSQAYKNHDTSVAFSGQWHYSGYQAEHICIHLNNIEDEKRYSVNYDYLTQLFSEQEIENFHHFIINILTQALNYPQRPIRELSFLGIKEEERVLFGFNRTEKYLRQDAIGQKFWEVCQKYPTRVAVIHDGRRFTYTDVWHRSQAVARSILANKKQESQIAAIKLPRSLDLLAAMAGAALSGMAWVIIPDNMAESRMKEILDDSCPDIIISQGALTEKIRDLAPAIPFMDMNTLKIEPDSEPICLGDSKTLAYLIYTSGSTGKPKGVEIEQLSLLNFTEGMQSVYGAGAVLSLCNTGFDAFLIESMVPLLGGHTIVLADEDAIENPAALAALIRSYAVGFLTTTPSRLQAYMKNEAFCGAVSRLEVILCGGEAFPGSLLGQLSRYTKAKIYNQYGPSETTVGVTLGMLNQTSHINVGRPMQNCRCYILDKYKNPLPAGVFGDLYIAGLCVGRGYHHMAEQTANAYFANPFELGERMYRSGDIGAWTAGGEIMLKGRRDGQVKLRGQRLELDEVSTKLMRHPMISEAVTRMIKWDDTELLAAYYTADNRLSDGELLEFAAENLPDYMVPAAFIYLREIPLTANGKVDVSNLPLPDRRQWDEDYTGGIMAGQILDIFRQILKKPAMPAGGDYFLYGGDSLNALETLTRLEELFDIRLKVADLYACRTALRLEERLGGSAGMEMSVKLPPLCKAPKLQVYPLTKTQLGIYFETMLHPESKSYNMPCAFRLKGLVDGQSLNRAYQKLLAAQPLLRASFVPGENGIGMTLEDELNVNIDDYSGWTLEAAKEAFVRVFDLSCPPLLRIGLWTDRGSSVILMDMHHIIGDGETAAMVIAQLDLNYRNLAGPAIDLTYVDYAYWRNTHAEMLEGLCMEYWRPRMASIPGLPEIPGDFERKGRFDHKGALEILSMTAEESRTCDAFCEQNGLTPFMLFSAAFGLLLSRICDCTEFMVGTPISNRRSKALESMLGLFVNTLPLTLKPTPEITVRDYLEQVKCDLIGLMDHADIPLDQLVKLSGANAGNTGNPLYNTMISMRPAATDNAVVCGFEVTGENLAADSAKTDLNLEIYRENGCYCFRLEYATSIYTKQSAAFYGRCLCTAALSLIEDHQRILKEIGCVSPVDSFNLMDLTQNLSAAFPDLPVDILVDRVAVMAPHQKALVFRNQILSLGELKKRSDQLAGRLQHMGVKHGDHVGILSLRGPELIIAMMAVLKTGCAYVPMLPSFPEARLEYMVDISGVKLTLCDQKTMQALPVGLGCAFIPITDDEAKECLFIPPTNRNGEDVCFILFTSGSTGQPKGVMIRHRSISNLYAVMYPKLAPAAGGFLCTANAIFDIFITETLLTMAMGNYTVMADEDEMVLPWKCAKLIKEHHVRVIEFTPSRASLFIEHQEFYDTLSDMPVLLMCGEVFPMPLLKKFRQSGCRKIYNLYGPTEVTVYCTMDDVTDAEKITVGRIFPNCRAYVLDENMKQVMPTAKGEMYFGGECVSAGYVGRADLTQELFVEDPYQPGHRLYKSGDIVRLLPDGRFDFVGRGDHQVKLNGQRVELAEISRKFISSGMVAQAAVVVVSDGDFKVLKAFVTQKKDMIPDMKALRKYLEQELPGYMVPPSIHVLEKLPVTASGKTDLKALEQWEPEEAEMQPSVAEIEVQQVQILEAPEISMEQLWKDALSVNEIDPELSFFEQGGTSLTALNLLSRYYNRGLSMTLAQFYGNPTLNGQKKFFENINVTAETQIMESVPEKEIISCVQPKTAGKQDAVFLTGATGFFGAHLLKELVDKGYSNIYCLVRGTDETRLEEMLAWYFGRGFAVSIRKKVKVILGDIVEEQFGMDSACYKELTKNVGLIIHAAADVRHYAATDSAFLTNRDGTYHVLNLAKQSGARMIHISTVSLGSEYIRNHPEKTGCFSEDDFDIGQNWEDNIYLRGKFEGERLVREAAGAGLPVMILRIGRLVGRSSDGVFQKNPSSNAFWGLVSGIIELGLVSHELADLAMDTTAVDECAAAAITLVEKGHRMVYHLYNPIMKNVREMIDILGVSVAETSREAFEQRLRDLTQSGSSVGLPMLLNQYNRFAQVPVRITPICETTIRELDNHGFTWRTPDIARLLEAF